MELIEEGASEASEGARKHALRLLSGIHLICYCTPLLLFAGTLVISTSKAGDVGTYRCEAENKLGKLQQSFRLTISCKFPTVRFRTLHCL